MPPKPQVFKTPDGKEFTSRAEWRDYMMATFYSYKNRVNEPEPLIKRPGDIDGQMFDIADCENSTMVVLDYCEQVQMDELKNCRVFIGACASSIFIRNCKNCVFYTCCRQLRLRDVVDCNFFIYSMAEVHIEFSRNVRFAPFNGGYPEQARHLQQANLDPTHNLWYDIFDHNDPAKTRENWSLLPESEYEPAWFPAGETAPAIPFNRPGTVEKPEEPKGDNNMQSFSLQQMMADAQALASKATAATAAAASETTTAGAAAAAVAEQVLPPAPPCCSSSAPPCTAESTNLAVCDQCTCLATALSRWISAASSEDAAKVVLPGAIIIVGSGESHDLAEYGIASQGTLWHWEPSQCHCAADFAWIAVWFANELQSEAWRATVILQQEKGEGDAVGTWKLAHMHRSDGVPIAVAPHKS